MLFPPSFNYWYSLIYQQKRVSLGNLGCYFSLCSDSGELYSKKLANFVEKRLKNERAASVSLSNFIRFWVMKLIPLTFFILNLTSEMICFRNFCLTTKKTNLLYHDICVHDSLQRIDIGCELVIFHKYCSGWSSIYLVVCHLEGHLPPSVSLVVHIQYVTWIKWHMPTRYFLVWFPEILWSS